MNDSLKIKETIDPPIIELLADDKSIFLNVFTQNIIASLNLSCLELLRGTPARENVENFEILLNLQKKLGESTKIAILHVNGNHIGNKPFIQDMIRGYNVGLISTLQKIPENVQEFVIKYSKPKNLND